MRSRDRIVQSKSEAEKVCREMAKNGYGLFGKKGNFPRMELSFVKDFPWLCQDNEKILNCFLECE